MQSTIEQDTINHNRILSAYETLMQPGYCINEGVISEDDEYYWDSASHIGNLLCYIVVLAKHKTWS